MALIAGEPIILTSSLIYLVFYSILPGIFRLYFFQKMYFFFLSFLEVRKIRSLVRLEKHVFYAKNLELRVTSQPWLQGLKCREDVNLELIHGLKIFQRRSILSEPTGLFGPSIKIIFLNGENKIIKV